MEQVIRGYRKTRTGVVVSDKMDKTVVVAISTKVQGPPSPVRQDGQPDP